MSKYPVKAASRKLRKIDDGAVEVIRPDAVVPFVSFRYSYTEISGGAAPKVKARKASFENGKLTSESFEGELSRNVYDHVVSDAAQFFLSQTASFMNAVLELMAPATGSRGERD